jgi:hypothetical protein
MKSSSAGRDRPFARSLGQAWPQATGEAGAQTEMAIHPAIRWFTRSPWASSSSQHWRSAGGLLCCQQEVTGHADQANYLLGRPSHQRCAGGGVLGGAEAYCGQPPKDVDHSGGRGRRPAPWGAAISLGTAGACVTGVSSDNRQRTCTPSIPMMHRGD